MIGNHAFIRKALPFSLNKLLLKNKRPFVLTLFWVVGHSSIPINYVDMKAASILEIRNAQESNGFSGPYCCNLVISLCSK